MCRLTKSPLFSLIYRYTVFVVGPSFSKIFVCQILHPFPLQAQLWPGTEKLYEDAAGSFFGAVSGISQLWVGNKFAPGRDKTTETSIPA